MRLLVAALLYFCFAQNASANTTILCPTCGDPTVNYRNYGAAAYNMALGAGSEGWGTPGRAISTGLAAPIIVANPVASTHATVMIDRGLEIEVQAGLVPLVSMEKFWEIIVQAPDGSFRTYEVLVGTNQLYVEPVPAAEPESATTLPLSPLIDPVNVNLDALINSSSFYGYMAPTDFRFYTVNPIFFHGGGGGFYGTPLISIMEMGTF